MFSRLSVLSAGLVILLAGGAVAVQGNPASELKSASKSELSFHKNAVKQALSNYCDTLDQIADDVGSGALTPDAALDQITAATNAFVDDLSVLGDQISRNLEFFAGALLQGTSGIPAGFLLGDCGTLDRFSASIGKTVAKTISKVLKKLKKIAKAAQGGANYGVNPGLGAPVPPPPPAPVPGPPPPPPPKPLKINALAGGSDITAANDGKLCVGGTADPANGNVDVTINGPGGTMLTQNVAVDPVTCRWQACFPAMGVPNLPEGNYQVQAAQAGVAVNNAIGVPGAP